MAAELWGRLKEASEAGGSGKVPADSESDIEMRNEKLNERIAALVGSEPHKC